MNIWPILYIYTYRGRFQKNRAAVTKQATRVSSRQALGPSKGIPFVALGTILPHNSRSEVVRAYHAGRKSGGGEREHRERVEGVGLHSELHAKERFSKYF